jgi:iron complex outermembrane receptor protein
VPEVETTLPRRVTVQLALQGDVEVPLALPSVQPGQALGPRASVQWRPGSGLSLSVSAARTTRFPGLKERFSQGQGFTVPNPTLGPESAWSGALEVRWAPRAELELLALLSHSEVQGLITQVSVAGGLTQLQNVARAQLSSVEGRAAFALERRWRLELGVQGLRVVQLTDSGPVPLDYRAPVQGTAQLRFRPVEALSFWAGVRASSTRPFLNPDTRKEDALPAFADVSLRAEARPVPTVGVWLRASNLLDTAVDSQYGFPRPGRQLFVGLSLDVAPPAAQGWSP